MLGSAQSDRVSGAMTAGGAIVSIKSFVIQVNAACQHSVIDQDLGGWSLGSSWQTKLRSRNHTQ